MTKTGSKKKTATTKKKTAKKTSKTAKKAKSKSSKAAKPKAGAKKTAAKKSKAAKKTAKTSSKKATAKKAAKKPSSKKAATKKAPVSRPARAARTTKASAAASGVKTPEAPIKVPPLSKRIARKDLNEIRKRLVNQLKTLLGSIDSLGAEYLGTNENVTTRGGDEADQASTALTADLSLRLAESESKMVREVQLALNKIEDGSYGVCEVTGQPINIQRLLAVPWARLSLEAQERLERQQIVFDEATGWVAADEL